MRWARVLCWSGSVGSRISLDSVTKKTDAASDQSVKQSVNVKTSEFWALTSSNNSPVGALILVMTFCLEQLLKLQDRLINQSQLFSGIMTTLPLSPTGLIVVTPWNRGEELKLRTAANIQCDPWPDIYLLDRLLWIGQVLADRTRHAEWQHLQREDTKQVRNKDSTHERVCGQGVTSMSGSRNRKCPRLWKPLQSLEEEEMWRHPAQIKAHFCFYGTSYEMHTVIWPG